MIRRYLFALAMVLAAAPALAQAPAAPAAAEEAPGDDLGMFNTSSQFTFEQVSANHLRLTGDVEMEGDGGVQLFADTVDYYLDENRIVASGNVVFSNAEGSISAARVEFDAETGLGTFEDASGILSLGPRAGAASFGGPAPEVYFYAETLEKTGPRRYRLTRGGFSACVQPTPRWEVTSGRMELNLDEYTMAVNTILRVKGVPVFYLPILYYPIQDDDRATGFLMPTYGSSTLRGQAISNAFFWAMGRSQDATFFHDWFTRTGQGAGAEYRYVAGPQSRGTLRLYRFAQNETAFDNDGETSVLPATTSYEVAATLTQRISDTVRARARVDYFSDVTTQQLYQQDIYQASQRARYVEGGITGSFGRLRTSAVYQRNELFTDATSLVVYGSTPRVTANLGQTRLFGSPVYGSFSTEFAYQPYRYLTDEVVTRDDTRTLIQFAPELRVPLSRLTYLSVNTSATYRSTYYSRSLNAEGEREEVPFTRQFLSFDTQIVGPVFNRIFDTRNDFAERLKHVIEPTFAVGYELALADVDRQPLVVASSDTGVGNAGRVTYGLVNRFFLRAPGTGVAPGATREFLTVELRQTAYGDPRSSLRDTSYSSPSNDATLSPVQLTTRVAPTAFVEASTRVEYDVVRGDGLKLFTASARASGEAVSGTVAYNRSRPSPEATPNSYLSGSTTLRLQDGRTTGTYGLSWDIARGYVVSQSVSAAYMAQCCGLQVEFQNFSFPRDAGFPIPSDRRFNVAVVLAGLGTFSNFFGAFGGR